MEIPSYFDKSIFAFARNNDHDKLKSLLNETDFDINDRDDHGRSALHICATFDSLECTR